MLQQGRYRERLDSLLEIRDEIIENPERHVTEHDTIFAQVEVPQALLVLSRCILDLERLVARVLFHVMQQSQSITQPEHSEVEVITFLQHTFNSVQIFDQQRSYFIVVVDVVGVSDAHEKDVGR